MRMKSNRGNKSFSVLSFVPEICFFPLCVCLQWIVVWLTHLSDWSSRLWLVQKDVSTQARSFHKSHFTEPEEQWATDHLAGATQEPLHYCMFITVSIPDPLAKTLLLWVYTSYVTTPHSNNVLCFNEKRRSSRPIYFPVQPNSGGI